MSKVDPDVTITLPLSVWQKVQWAAYFGCVKSSSAGGRVTTMPNTIEERWSAHEALLMAIEEAKRDAKL